MEVLLADLGGRAGNLVEIGPTEKARPLSSGDAMDNSRSVALAQESGGTLRPS